MRAEINMSSPLKIGTRASPLAVAQAEETRARLISALNLEENAVQIVKIVTTGDKRLEKKLGDLGGKGLFTKEVEDALLDGSVDLAVHSMKDMPTVLPEGLEISALLPREDVRDAFISEKYQSLDQMPNGAVVGTASLRRQAQLLYARPDLRVCLFRGNVQTRLAKLKAGEADATFLAMAGLSRLGMTEVATQIIETERMLPAVAQGAIGIESRIGDERITKALTPLNCHETQIRLEAERAFLAALDGSCRTPIAALALLEGDRLIFRAEILREDGSEKLETERTGTMADAAALGKAAGEELKQRAGKGFFG